MIPPPTARLFFREWQTDDLPLAEALWGDARVTARIGAQDPRARLAAELGSQQESGLAYWPVFLLGSLEHVGCCGLRPYAEGVAELGFHLCPERWGQGFATEAARAVIDFARTKGLTGLFAGHHPENLASRRTLLKLGFAYTHDQLYPPTGVLEPAYRLTL
jgi:RimJ/RimL family protein N-acetyltransferase